MDPITSAIVAAVAASAAKVGGQVVVDAYNGLKELIRRKFGADSKVAKAVAEIEANPESKTRPSVLNEEVLAAKAHEDQELLTAAKALIDKLGEQLGGAQVIQTATGSNIAQAAGGSTATVNANVPPKP